MTTADGVLDRLMMVKTRAPGLNLGQLAALLHTARSEGVRMTELADLCQESLANTSRHVRSLTSADYAGWAGRMVCWSCNEEPATRVCGTFCSVTKVEP